MGRLAVSRGGQWIAGEQDFATLPDEALYTDEFKCGRPTTGNGPWCAEHRQRVVSCPTPPCPRGTRLGNTDEDSASGRGRDALLVAARACS